jgi:pantoate--beta-alanine ligase
MGVETVTRTDELRQLLQSIRAEGRSVGFVATMGGLHAGHQALVSSAAADADVVVVSIFVNPLQFGEESDLLNYPRDMETDSRLALEAGADIIFAPSVEEMYAGGEVLTAVSVGSLAEEWEGATRPGHFDGVATVVSKLFNIVGPCTTYFGEKDFQQLTVIRRMVDDLSVPVDVVGVSTVREPDGLAMSSRNVFLVGPHRKAATVLRRAALAGKALIEGGETDPVAVAEAMAALIDAEVLAELVYAVAVDAGTLQVPEVLSGDVRLLLAAQVGIPRLIDNEGAVVTIASADEGV